MAANVNSVTLTGNLTRDPETREVGQTSITKLRVASNTRRKGQDGSWEDRPNYFDVTVWGAQGENCARYLSRGSGVALAGRLEWREWEQDGAKRQAVEIVAEQVQFLSSAERQPDQTAQASRDTDSFPAAPSSSGYVSTDNIPF